MPRWFQHVKNHAKSDFRFLLLAQLVFGVFAYSQDIFYPFSANRTAASYLESHHLDHAVLVVPEAVAQALGKSTYFPEYDKVGKYMLHSDRYLPSFVSIADKTHIDQRIWRYVSKRNKSENVVVITDQPATSATLKKYFLWQAPPTIIRSERYYLYLISQGTWQSPQNALHRSM